MTVMSMDTPACPCQDELTSQSSLDLLVDEYIDPHPSLSSGFEQSVQAVFLILGRGSAQVQFGAVMCKYEAVSWLSQDPNKIPSGTVRTGRHYLSHQSRM